MLLLLDRLSWARLGNVIYSYYEDSSDVNRSFPYFISCAIIAYEQVMLPLFSYADSLRGFLALYYPHWFFCFVLLRSFFAVVLLV